MAYILDGVVILIFLMAVAIGHRRGFIKTVAGMVAFLAALAVAMLLSGPVAQLVYDTAVEPPLVETINEHMEAEGATAIQKLDNVFQALPPMVRSLLANVGVEDVDAFANVIPMGTQTPMAESISNGVIAPLLVPLLRVLCMLVLFLLAYIGARVLFKVLNVVAKLPLLKQLNKSLGLISGVVSGVLWVLLVVTVIQVLAATNTFITQQALNDSLLTNWLVGLNPLGSVLHETLVIID